MFLQIHRHALCLPWRAQLHLASPPSWTSSPLWATVFPGIHTSNFCCHSKRIFILDPWETKVMSENKIKLTEGQTFRTTKARHEWEIVNKRATFKGLCKQKEDKCRWGQAKDWLPEPQASWKAMLAHSGHLKLCLNGSVGGSNHPGLPGIYGFQC